MKVGSVPASLVVKAKRLDAEFFLGDPLAAPIAATRKRLADAEKRLAKLLAEQAQQDAERVHFGIKKEPT